MRSSTSGDKPPIVIGVACWNSSMAPERNARWQLPVRTFEPTSTRTSSMRQCFSVNHSLCVVQKCLQIKANTLCDLFLCNIFSQRDSFFYFLTKNCTLKRKIFKRITKFVSWKLMKLTNNIVNVVFFLQIRNNLK